MVLDPSDCLTNPQGLQASAVVEDSPVGLPDGAGLFAEYVDEVLVGRQLMLDGFEPFGGAGLGRRDNHPVGEVEEARLYGNGFLTDGGLTPPSKSFFNDLLLVTVEVLDHLGMEGWGFYRVPVFEQNFVGQPSVFGQRDEDGLVVRPSH
jgi:hypothetical protein